MTALPMPSPGRKAARVHGFTLLEVLVAFIIAALAVTVLMDNAINALSATHMASRIDEAVIRADSHLAAAAAAPLAESDRQGDEGAGFHWRIQIVRLGEVHPARALTALPPGIVALYRIDVTVSWQDRQRRQVRLESSRLGPVT